MISDAVKAALVANYTALGRALFHVQRLPDGVTPVYIEEPS